MKREMIIIAFFLLRRAACPVLFGFVQRRPPPPGQAKIMYRTTIQVNGGGSPRSGFTAASSSHSSRPRNRPDRNRK